MLSHPHPTPPELQPSGRVSFGNAPESFSSPSVGLLQGAGPLWSSWACRIWGNGAQSPCPRQGTG